MTAWTRVHYDPSFGSGWRCGSAVITDGFLSEVPRDEVQRVAVKAAGLQLPDEAWPIEPEPPLFTTVAEMEAAILDLLSRPRKDDAE